VIDLAQHPLVLAAEAIFKKERFRSQLVLLPGEVATVLIVEDEFSVAAILGVDEWRDLREVLGDIATAFANWALGRDAGPKQWDLYVIALAVSPVTDEADLVAVEEWIADTRYVRRMVRHGVTPTSARVRVALEALLSLELPARVAERDVYSALVAGLENEGIDASTANEMVSRFSLGAEST
jgi:hypothetical protein